jgi:hypothetical protein
MCQNAVLRHGTISDFQHGVAYPGNGLYEFLLIKDCGKQLGAHGNGFFCSYPYPAGKTSAGNFTARYVNIDMPCPSSPDWQGNSMTACVSIFNGFGGKPAQAVRNVVFENCRFNGGAYAVSLYSRFGNDSGTNPIADVSLRNCAFGREFEFVSPVSGPVLLDGAYIHNAVFDGCFWEDSGELIETLNGLWSTAGGNAVRSGL